MTGIQYIMNCEGDWCALYVNGELYHEGHEIPAYVWAEVIGALHIYDDEEKCGPYLEKWGGRYPPTWVEVEAVLNG